ncbi:MAG: mannose-1-phosphate guanylyltransferase [Acidobacteria bacterium]|nr:mannose-1-phosphate guanylyltransferase [Acidobacteriota bacterium]
MPGQHYHGLILAGGRGTRFWPLSRKSRAKQVLNFFGERSLIQQTVDRLGPVIAPERIWVLTNDHLRDEIVRQLPEVPRRQIIAEPAQRNTAPAIGLAAKVIESMDPEAVMGVFPADHVVEKPKRFLRMVRPALRAAAAGRIAVLGIQPRWPETGYGYIEFPPGAEAGSTVPVAVRRFREKPDQATAEQFLAAGHYCWNAGMFFWKASRVLDELRQHLPATAALLDRLPGFHSRRFTASMNDLFPQCENISIDYAVLERAKEIWGFATDDIGWNDVGSWNAVYELDRGDATGNVVRGEAILESSRGNYVNAHGKLVALLGVDNLVVVDTPDALLIADRSRAQQVGDIVKMIERHGRHELL